MKKQTKLAEGERLGSGTPNENTMNNTTDSPEVLPASVLFGFDGEFKAFVECLFMALGWLIILCVLLFVMGVVPMLLCVHYLGWT